MFTYHTKLITANSSLTKIQNPNKSNMEMPVFYFKDMLMINFNVVDSSGSPINLSGATFALAIDSGYGPNKALCRSDNSMFIAANRSDWNLSQGKICCKVNLNDVRIGTYLSGDISNVGYCALWAYIGSIGYILCQFQITLKNIIK